MDGPSPNELWSSVKRKAINRKALYVLGALFSMAIIGAVVFFILDAVLWHPSVPVPSRMVLPKVQDEALIPTELTRSLEIFGPWDSPNFNEKGESVNDPRILLLLKENGGMRVSVWGIELPNSQWTNTIPPEISQMTVEKNVVHIATNKNRVFTVNVNQPFLLEQTPLMIYLIDPEGQILGISASEAEALRYSIR